MTTCIVIGAGNFAQDHVDIGEGNFCIAVDGGYAYCRQLGIEPDLIIGDMDSLGARENKTGRPPISLCPWESSKIHFPLSLPFLSCL